MTTKINTGQDKTWQSRPIHQREDGSFVIYIAPNIPYHVPVSGEYAQLYETIKEFVEGDPSVLEPEAVRVLIDANEIEDRFHVKVNIKLQQFAKQKGYATIDKAMLMATQYSKWQQDGIDAYNAYNAIWEKAIELQPLVAEGKLSYDEAFAKLPELKWTTPVHEKVKRGNRYAVGADGNVFNLYERRNELHKRLAAHKNYGRRARVTQEV